MASTYYSSAVLNKDYPSSNVPTGMVLAAKGTYTVPSGDLEAGDTVQMVWVPKGAVIIDVILTCTNGTVASMTIDVGDGADPDRYIDGVDGSAAFITSLSSAGDTANDGVGHEYTAADTIDILLSHAALEDDAYTLVVTYTIAQ